MNFNGLNRSLSKVGPEITLKILDLEAQVSEKIHGENFRVGIDEGGKTFIGQRNGTFYDHTTHVNWNRMNGDAQETVIKLINIAKSFYEVRNLPITFYGELCGNGMQSGFVYPWDGLMVVYFDVREGDTYVNPIRASEWFNDHEIPQVPIYHESMTVREALTLNVNITPSLLTNNDNIEGVVVKPNDLDALNQIWKFDTRFIIKHKSDSFSEMSKPKDRTPKVKYDSPFVDFVTTARIEHAIQAIEERDPGAIKNEMADMRYIVREVIADIEREENDGVAFEKGNPDKGSISRAIPKIYLHMLNTQVQKALGL